MNSIRLTFIGLARRSRGEVGIKIPETFPEFVNLFFGLLRIVSRRQFFFHAFYYNRIFGRRAGCSDERLGGGLAWPNRYLFKPRFATHREARWADSLEIGHTGSEEQLPEGTKIFLEIKKGRPEVARER